MNADLVIRNARVFTADSDMPFVEGVAIAGKRVAGIGTVDDLIGPATKVIDAEGALVTPGFIDAHVHPVTSGLDRLQCSFDGCENKADALRAVAAYAAGHPEDEWILGAGWAMSWFENGCPSAADLDAVVADRPVFLMNADGHGAWVNSRALELAGITAASTDPADGRIERLADDSPQGTLHEGAAALVERIAPQPSVDDFVAGLETGQKELLRYGVTGWQDAAVLPEVHAAYLRFAGAGRLKGRVVGALWWDRHRGTDQVDELLARRQERAPHYRPTSVKLMLDGVAENYTASTLDPWLDVSGQPTANHGKDFIDPGALKAIVTELDRLGVQCHFHSLGDRAVRNALDAVEAAVKANGRRGNRHHLAHLQFVHPDDIPRFGELDAIANAQPLWACNDDYQIELTKPFITEERFTWQYPFGSLLRSGARLGMGSDWGVSTANVMEEIDVAINRTCPEGEPLGIDEAIDPVEALTAFTYGSAYINGVEKETGMLAVGYKADLAVFDRDPFTDGPFRDAKAVMTIIGGEVVYEA